MTQQEKTVRPSILCDEIGCKLLADYSVKWTDDDGEAESFACTQHVGDHCHYDVPSTVVMLP